MLALLFVSCDEITDIFPPEIELLSPSEEVLTADSVTFLVDVTDNIAIDRVKFEVRDPVSGNKINQTMYSPPFQLEVFDVQSWSQIELEVIAYDDVGNFRVLEKTLLIQSTVDNASITVSEPNGGELWFTGATETIRWTSVDVPGNVKIELYKGNSFHGTVVSNAENDGVYAWNISEGIEAATNFKIKITWVDYTSVYDYSDESFTIESTVDDNSITVTDPNGGESWLIGAFETIRWTSVDVPGNVKIELYEGNNLKETIVASTNNDGVYTWEISDGIEPGSNFKIKITWVDNTSVYDYSDNSFTIETGGSDEENIAVEEVTIEPTSVSSGGEVDVSFSVSNSGSSNITNAGADIFLSTSSSSYTSGTLLFQGSFPSGIDPGMTDWEAEITIPSSTSDGTYYVFVVITYGDDNQSDNYDYATLNVTSGGGVSFFEDFEDLDDWTNNGWSISTSNYCADPPCAYFSGSSSSSTPSMSINVNVTAGQTLSFTHYTDWNPITELYLNNSLFWTASVYGYESPEFDIDFTGTLNIQFNGSMGSYDRGYIDNLIIE